MQEPAVEPPRTSREPDAALTGGLPDILSPLQQIVVGHAHRIPPRREVLERILARGDEVGGLHPRHERLDALHLRNLEQIREERPVPACVQALLHGRHVRNRVAGNEHRVDPVQRPRDVNCPLAGFGFRQQPVDVGTFVFCGELDADAGFLGELRE